MSTSVVLEGQISTDEQASAWKGIWRFAKDKKGTLQFQYEKVGYDIPGDLMDYVSFLDPVSIANQLNTKTEFHHFKHKKHKRGRPPSIAVAPPGPPTSVANLTTALPSAGSVGGVLGEAVNSSAAAGPGTAGPEAAQPTPDAGSTALTAAVIPNEQVIMDVSGPAHSEQPAEPQPAASREGTLPADTAASAGAIMQPAIDSAAEPPPLDDPQFDEPMDMEVSEDVPAAEQEQEQEPSSSSSLAAVSAAVALAAETVPRDPVTIPCGHPLLGLWQGHFSVTSAKGEDVVPETFFFHAVLGAEVLQRFADLPPEPSFPFCLLKSHHLPSVMDEPVAVAAGAEDAADPSAPPPGSMLESLYKKVLVGFGRNAIGRFSVAALYDERANELRCEKKYMATKFAIKRGRRSHAEYALSYGYPASNPPNAMTTRHSEGVEAPTIPDPPTGRAHRSAYSNNHYVNNAHRYASAEEEGVGKRRRSASIRDSFHIVPAYQGTGSAGGKASKEELAAFYAEQYADHPYALVGDRNPDNDAPDGFRPAFLDRDLGEIYEGQWMHGRRHGCGICLYADGLMYEGQWARGREHGPGMLMTGDRRVIYQGDWLDGYMHGHGEYHFGNGDIYVGDFKEGNRHGRGDYRIRAGNCRYVGDWRDNKRHGKGRFTWGDGGYYEGDWEGDLRSGRGVLELADGFKYEGGWVANVMEGKGVCTYAAAKGASQGQTYQGTFKGGLRDGRGSIFFPEGNAVYEGRFKEDRFDGQGTLKINSTTQGSDSNEVFIPIQIQSDMWRIHWKAGFGANAH